VENKYDLAAALAKVKAEQESAGKLKALRTKLQRAQRTQDWETALTTCDELIALDKARAGVYVLEKFNTYLRKSDYPKAYAMKDQILATPGANDNSQILNEIAWTIVDPNGDVLVKNRDLNFALAIAVRADEVAKHEDGPIIDTVARCHWEKGDKQKALKMQEEAVKVVEAQLKAAREANDENKINGLEQMSSQIKDTLQEYKKKIAETTG
jgi:tetratricopeptide (TPR) repeat protein